MSLKYIQYIVERDSDDNGHGCIIYAMICQSERPPGVSSVGNRIWDVVNCTAVNRTCLPWDPPHVKCG